MAEATCRRRDSRRDALRVRARGTVVRRRMGEIPPRVHSRQEPANQARRSTGLRRRPRLAQSQAPPRRRRRVDPHRERAPRGCPRAQAVASRRRHPRPRSDDLAVGPLGSAQLDEAQAICVAAALPGGRVHAQPVEPRGVPARCSWTPGDDGPVRHPGSGRPRVLRRTTAGTCDVVAPGNDQHRDWPTLAEVARLRPGLDFWVASGASSARAVTWPPNVRVQRLNDTAAYASLLARAGVCVFALRPNLHVSGMTANVEAASVGTPAVVAGDGGLRAILGPGPRFVPEGDAEAIAGAIDDVLRDVAEGRAEVPQVAPRGLTQADYVTRYALLTDMVCSDRPWNERVSSLEPQSRPETARIGAHEHRRATRVSRATSRRWRRAMG